MAFINGQLKEQFFLCKTKRKQDRYRNYFKMRGDIVMRNASLRRSDRL
ncbi:hypothetical protein [Janthinobacterium sp. B9-8]|nr:hypothetical protein [Janthinobacterium sp. B9-8]